MRVVRRERLWKVAETTGQDLAKRLTDHGLEAVAEGMHLAVHVPTPVKGDARKRLREGTILVPPTRKGGLPVHLRVTAAGVEVWEAVDGFARVLAAPK